MIDFWILKIMPYY